MTAKVSLYTETDGDGGFTFLCPGCGQHHGVPIGHGKGPRWTFNGDVEKPTISPSLLVRGGHHNPHAAGRPCWCDYKERTGRDAPFKCGVCHSFIVDGRIQFLGDCTHALAGQTVDLPPVEED